MFQRLIRISCSINQLPSLAHISIIVFFFTNSLLLHSFTLLHCLPSFRQLLTLLNHVHYPTVPTMAVLEPGSWGIAITCRQCYLPNHTVHQRQQTAGLVSVRNSVPFGLSSYLQALDYPPTTNFSHILQW